jgi:hypothetical protein
MDHEKHPFCQEIWALGDEMMGYVKPKLERKWWFDLEDVNGVLTVPSRAGERGNNIPK